MDAREFDEFYAASYHRITRQVYALIGNLDEAQECTQEAFVRAWAHRRRLDGCRRRSAARSSSTTSPTCRCMRSPST